MTDDLSLWGLFLSALVSSTLFPGGSELVLGVLARNGEHPPEVLLAIATFGNTLGAFTTLLLGWLVAQRWPAETRLPARRQQALMRVKKWGSPVLLLSWLPVIGDPLCFAAGYLRMSWTAALVFIALGKLARYGVILLALTR